VFVFVRVDTGLRVVLCAALHDAHWSALYVCTNDVALFRCRPIGVRVCGADPRGGFDDNGAGFDDDEEGGSFGHHRSGGGGGLGAVPASDGALDMDGAAGLEWFIHAGLGGKMAWAGPSHWRFKAPPKAAKAGGEEGGEVGLCRLNQVDP
jgi:hypothetical protein